MFSNKEIYFFYLGFNRFFFFDLKNEKNTDLMKKKYYVRLVPRKEEKYAKSGGFSWKVS